VLFFGDVFEDFWFYYVDVYVYGRDDFGFFFEGVDLMCYIDGEDFVIDLDRVVVCCDCECIVLFVVCLG